MNYELFSPLLGDWGPVLKPFIESEECNRLYSQLKDESKRKGKNNIFPSSDRVYRAFKETPYGDLKAVFVLLDPYPSVKRVQGGEIVVADGIAMSCSNTETEQPSLKLFYDAIEEDMYKGLNLNMQRLLDLKYLCNQGVLLTNTALTVERDITGSHKEIWKPFMRYLYEDVFSKYTNGLIFVLCGKDSQEFAKWINPLQHYIFELEHPSFAARQNRPWDHQNIFTKINRLLTENNNQKVEWAYETPPF